MTLTSNPEIIIDRKIDTNDPNATDILGPLWTWQTQIHFPPPALPKKMLPDILPPRFQQKPFPNQVEKKPEADDNFILVAQPLLQGDSLVVALKIPFVEVSKRGAWVSIQVVHVEQTNNTQSIMHVRGRLRKKVHASKSSGLQPFEIPLRHPEVGITDIRISVKDVSTGKIVRHSVPFTAARALMGLPV